jgi:uncharacterized peroxidase-related enzyme
MSYIKIIDETDATGELAALYQRCGNPDGTVDNVMKVHALNPESLRTHFEMYTAAMHKPSPLSRAERELIAVVVSRLNGCHYCVQHHLAGLKRLIPADRHDTAEHLSTGRITRLTERERALVSYATKLTQNPHDMDHLDVRHLRDVGLDDRAILDLAQVVGYFNYANRIVRGLGVQLEGDDFTIGQTPTE